VDFIFMVGHWNREIGNAHIVDCQHGPPALALEAGEQQGGDRGREAGLDPDGTVAA
jgi:hypothetical protein